MFRPLPFVAMRQQHHQPAQPAPLGFAGADELVDHHLGAIGEIAELRFPDHQFVRLGRSVAVLEAEHRLFRQHRIDHQEARLLVGYVLQRDVHAGIPFLPVLVVQHGMAVEERAAPAVLAGNPHRETVFQQGGIGQIFRHAPVERQLAFAHLAAVGNDLFHPRMQLEIGGNCCQHARQTLQVGQRHGGVGRIVPFAFPERRPVRGEGFPEIGQHRSGHGNAGIEIPAVSGDHFLRVVRRQHPLGHQPVGVELARTGMLGDLLVHQRLGHQRLVLFVVAQAPVAHQVDHHVLVEIHAVVERDFRHQQHRFRIIAVDMENRRAPPSSPRRCNTAWNGYRAGRKW